MSLDKPADSPTFRPRQALWLLLPLALGLLVSLLIPRPVVGTITLNNAIYNQTASEMVTQIRYAREHSDVRAVVLILDSPGGTVTDTETVYLELAALRREKPVVAMVQGLAASGAYYLSVGTNWIVASPSADVGNVGVIAQLPPEPVVYEDIVSTGPYKLWGSPRDALLRTMEAIKESFYQAVKLGRGETLKIGPEIVLRGEIWTGSEALRLGLVDDLGSRSDAIRKAAELAAVAHYEVADLKDLAGLAAPAVSPFFATTPNGLNTPYPSTPGLYLLYIPPPGGGLP